MRAFLHTIIFGCFAALVSVNLAYASPHHCNGKSCGGRAPAPELGSSLIGLGMAGALSFYVVRRRRNVRA